MENSKTDKLGSIYDLVTGDEDARVCKDIPEEACQYQPRNFFAYLVSNLLSKLADELASARLILPWMMGALGVPAFFVGFLVPIREAGILLPQLFVAAYIRKKALRKYVWMTGAGLTGVAIFGMGLTHFFTSTITAGLLLLFAMVMASLARGICSVSAKDVLGKTISKSRRGTLMGFSSGIAGLLTLLLGLIIEFKMPAQNDAITFSWILFAAAILWFASLFFFNQIIEEPGATEGGGNAISSAIAGLAIVLKDRPFRNYLIARTLLLSAALVAPFYVLMAQEYSRSSTGLGILIISSGLAGSLSSPIWGKMGDWSSKMVMAIASALSGVLGLLVWYLESIQSPLLSTHWIFAVLYFLVTVFHSGVRLGRKVYLVDLATAENRSTYVAVSNTLIGLFMLVGGAIGVVGDYLSSGAVIGLLGILSLLSTIFMLKLKTVSD